MSWEQLLDIDKDFDHGDDSVACPLCGTALVSGPRGERFCRFDGWRR